MAIPGKKESDSAKRANTKYESSPIQIKKRENRNKARYDLIKAGKAKKGDGKDVMHKDGNALNNDPSNWLNGSRHKNRSYRRDKHAHKMFPGS